MIIQFPLSIAIAKEEVMARVTLKDVVRALGFMLVALAASLLLLALIVGSLVLTVKVFGQEVVGQHYDHQGHEFPPGEENRCWIDGKHTYCFSGGHWAEMKPKPVKPKETPMYECPYGQHYHPLVKDVVPGDEEMWKHPDVQTQTIIPVLDGKCHSFDFDEALSERGRRISPKENHHASTTDR